MKTRIFSFIIFYILSETCFGILQSSSRLKLVQWKEHIQAKKLANKNEERKELEFLEKLQSQIESKTTGEITLLTLRDSLKQLKKNSLGQDTKLYQNDLVFILESLKLLEEIENKEDPLLTLQSYMDFSGLEKNKPASTFVESRAYYNKSQISSAKTVSLDEAAGSVEAVIFKADRLETDEFE